MKTYDSVLLARYLVALAYSKGIVLNMTKLQKLLFILYGYYQATHNHRIITEHPQAWPYGPVFPRVHKFVDVTKPSALDNLEFSEIVQDDLLNQTLNTIISKYSVYNASQLSGWSHMTGSPWERTTQTKDFKWSKEIPDEYISEYFSAKSIV
jgi:uncharacterized phage-associated protein